MHGHLPYSDWTSEEYGDISSRQEFRSKGWNVRSSQWNLYSISQNLHSILWNGKRTAIFNSNNLIVQNKSKTILLFNFVMI